jgi:hypothetical protein
VILRQNALLLLRRYCQQAKRKRNGSYLLWLLVHTDEVLQQIEQLLKVGTSVSGVEGEAGLVGRIVKGVQFRQL